MENAGKDKQFGIQKFGGVDVQSALLSTGQNEVSSMNGLFPEFVGSLSRMPGKVLLTTLGESVRQVYQIGDNVLVKSGQNLYFVSIDSLLGR